MGKCKKKISIFYKKTVNIYLYKKTVNIYLYKKNIIYINSYENGKKLKYFLMFL